MNDKKSLHFLYQGPKKYISCLKKTVSVPQRKDNDKSNYTFRQGRAHQQCCLLTSHHLLLRIKALNI